MNSRILEKETHHAHCDRCKSPDEDNIYYIPENVIDDGEGDLICCVCQQIKCGGCGVLVDPYTYWRNYKRDSFTGCIKDKDNNEYWYSGQCCDCGKYFCVACCYQVYDDGAWWLYSCKECISREYIIENKKLKERIKLLEDHIRFRPGGGGTMEAKEDFEKLSKSFD